MLSTIVLAVSVLVFLVVGILTWGALLQLGLWWTRAPAITFGRAVAIASCVYLIDVPFQALFAVLGLHSATAAVVTGIAAFITAVLISCLIISRATQLSFLRSLQAWLPTLASTIVLTLCAAAVFRPFLFQAYFAPTNSMAPTLLGNHWKAACAECGQPCYCTPAGAGRKEEQQMICTNFHVSHPRNVDPGIFGPDHFLVCKFLAPRRWDLVAFKYPGNPRVLYVKRLVGLPGESIVIDDGSVWANGQRLSPPAEIGKIEYLSELPGGFHPLWGSSERPAELSEDEYFVLGDFSAAAADSRVWDFGATGHHDFAVPKSHMVGVVTHIYWPVQRWRIFH